MNNVRTKQKNFFLILILGILNALTPFSIDMYLPAFPQIAGDLHTSIEKVAFSISTYFIGYAFGQIFYGPLLDHYGRKRPMYGGLIIYVIASFGCLNSTSIEMFLVFRFLQALGGCVASVGATAMVRDFFPVKDGAKVFSLLMLVLSVSPLLAPTLGSLVVTSWNWKIIFAILAGIGMADILLIYFFLPVGYVRDDNASLRFKPIMVNFKTILKEPQFYIYTLAGSFSFAGLFVYIAGSPAIFMDGFQVTAKEYGMIFAFLAAGMIGGGQLNLIFIKKFDNKSVFKMALIFQVIIGSIFFAGALQNAYGLFGTIAFLFLLLSCAGITYPNAASIALAPFSKNAGSAASLLGFIQLSLGALTSASVGFLAVKGTLPTAAVMCVSSFIGLTILLLCLAWNKELKYL